MQPATVSLETNPLIKLWIKGEGGSCKETVGLRRHWVGGGGGLKRMLTFLSTHLINF